MSWLAVLTLPLTFGGLLHAPAPREIVFAPTPGRELRLFVFEPSGVLATTPASAVLWIHGGGWTGGTCESIFPLARYTAARGAKAFVVEYRLVQPPDTTIRDSLADCRAAVRFVRQHAQELGIVPGRIAIMGESAGGQLAACTAMEGVSAGAGENPVSAVPDAMILYNPCLDFRGTRFIDLVRGLPVEPGTIEPVLALSPIHQVRAGLPPTLLVHGEADAVFPVETARAFATAMRAAGNRCDLVLLADTPHAFLIPNYKCSEEVVVHALRLADAFLVSLGFLPGEPTLRVSDPPSWEAKWPEKPAAARP